MFNSVDTWAIVSSKGKWKPTSIKPNSRTKCCPVEFLFWGCKIWKIKYLEKKSLACSFISYIFSASEKRKKEEMTSRTWFWEIGDDPNLSFDAMDTRIFVSATRHYRIYVTGPNTQQIKITTKLKKLSPLFRFLHFPSHVRSRSTQAKITSQSRSTGRDRARSYL